MHIRSGEFENGLRQKLTSARTYRLSEYQFALDGRLAWYHRFTYLFFLSF